MSSYYFECAIKTPIFKDGTGPGALLGLQTFEVGMKAYTSKVWWGDSALTYLKPIIFIFIIVHLTNKLKLIIIFKI